MPQQKEMLSLYCTTLCFISKNEECKLENKFNLNQILTMKNAFNKNI